MAVTDTVSCTYITEDPESGAIEVGLVWNNTPCSFPFADRATMVSQHTGGLHSQDEMVAAFFHWWLGRDPNASNDALVVGTDFDVDYGDDNPFKPVV